MLFNDQSIIRPDEDLFRRADFALTLARSIAGLAVADNGFSFAVTGKWGDGKSSVLRLIERYLRHIQMEQLSYSFSLLGGSPTPKTISELEAGALLYERVQTRIEEINDQGDLPYFLYQRHRETIALERPDLAVAGTG